MIKILLVEDESEKRRLLTATLLSVTGITLENITSVGDVRAAKIAIKETRYDLVILDINIPRSAEGPAEVGAGLAVLSFIKNGISAKQPGFIVGMSGYDEGLSVAAGEFSSPLWKLVRFSHTDLGWQLPLQEAVRYLVAQHRPPFISDGHSYHTDLAIFVALEDQELKSIRRLNAGWSERQIPHDHARYFEGKFNGPHGDVSVVVVAAPKMGMPAAAVVATKLILAYRPRFLAITGICAGVRGKVEMGDLLIADPCFDWGSGKWARDANSGNIKFRPAPYPWRLDQELRSAISRLAETTTVLDDIYERFDGPKPSKKPAVFVEAMASGGSVLQVAQLMEDVQEQHKNLVGVEMESYAVFTAAQYASEPRPRCISLKAVCDFGDEQKNDHVHAYAAHVSAEFLYSLALSYMVQQEAS